MRKSIPFEERFWRFVNKNGPIPNHCQEIGSCWVWTGAIAKNTGYGLASGPPIKLAHRFSWEMKNGKIPDGLCVLHKCDNRKCVNPDHLRIGTHKDNTQDMISKGRKGNITGEAHGHSKLTEKQVAEIKNLHVTSGIGCVKLGRMFNVSHSTISDIIRGVTWTHV